MKFAPAWYLIYTKPKHERKVASQLQERDISFFLPFAKMVRMWHDRKKIIDMPLFPSYIFVSIDTPEDYYASLQCEGALCYVRIGKESVRVREDIINGLKMIVNEGKNVEVLNGPIDPGRKYVIKMGVFAGLTCEVVEYKREEKVIVRIDLLNRSVLATLSHDVLVS